MSNTEIMIVEVNPSVPVGLEDSLENLGYRVTGKLDSIEKAMEGARETIPDVVLMNISRDRSNGSIDTAAHIYSSLRIPVIFLSDRVGPALLECAKQAGSFGYIIKPYTDSELYSAIELAVHRGKFEKEQTASLRAMHRGKRECERIIDTIPDMVTLIDSDFTFRRVNRKAADALGLSPKEAVGLKCHECFHGTDAPPEDCPHVQTLSDGGVHKTIRKDPCLGGEFEIRTAAAYDEDGWVTGSVHIMREITADTTRPAPGSN